MNSKMTTNSQLSINESKRKEKQCKQKLSKQPEQDRMREMDITQKDFSGEREGRNGGKRYREKEAWLVGIRQTGRDKKWYRKQRTQRTCMYNPWTWTKWGNAGELEQQGGGGQRE